MTKWEYVYVRMSSDHVESINGEDVGEYKGFFQGTTGQPIVSKFLEKSGQEGWEVVGLCPVGDSISWRLILKRPIL